EDGIRDFHVTGVQTCALPISFVGGTAYALFNGTMFAGRLLNQPLVARLGTRASLVVSGAILVVSGALLMLPAQLWLAVLAFALEIGRASGRNARGLRGRAYRE